MNLVESEQQILRGCATHAFELFSGSAGFIQKEGLKANESPLLEKRNEANYNSQDSSVSH